MTVHHPLPGRKVGLFSVVAVAATLGLTLAGCTSAANDSNSTNGGSTSGADTTGVIKIGLLPPTTGNAAAFGTEMMNGWNLYWKQHNNEADGHKVETDHLDYGGNVSTALTDVNKMINDDKVSMVVGALQSNASLAIIGPLTKAHIPYIEPVGGAMAMTMQDRSPYFIRLGGSTSSQLQFPYGAWAASQGYKKVVTICSDFNFGYEACGGFVDAFTDEHGQVDKQLWAPVGTTDFSSYISQIQQAKPDAVFAQFSGADNVRFLKAWSSFGLKGKIPLLAGSAMLDQTSLNGLSASDADGLISSGIWAGGLDNPPTKAFNKAYEAAYGTPPSFYSAAMYVAADGIAKGIAKMDGKVSNGAAFVKTLEATNLGNTPMGPITMDQYGNSVMNVYIRKVAVVDGKLVNQVIKTYPKVSQFWDYPVDEYLKHPDYSKTYQGNGVFPNPEK